MRILVLLGIGGCTVVPVQGTWQVEAPVVIEDGCRLYRTAAPTASTAELTWGAPGTFELAVSGADPAPCVQSGFDFTCEAVTDSLNLGVATVSRDTVLTGRFLDPRRAEGLITATLACEGALCGLLGTLGISLPCETTLDWAATGP